MPPLETMARHCPVVCSNISSMPEVIAAAGEYFDPTDMEVIGRAIEAVVYSDIRVAELIKLGDALLTSFSWKKCTCEALGVYRSLIQRWSNDEQ